MSHDENGTRKILFSMFYFRPIINILANATATVYYRTKLFGYETLEILV